MLPIKHVVFENIQHNFNLRFLKILKNIKVIIMKAGSSAKSTYFKMNNIFRTKTVCCVINKLSGGEMIF